MPYKLGQDDPRRKAVKAKYDRSAKGRAATQRYNTSARGRQLRLAAAKRYKANHTQQMQDYEKLPKVRRRRKVYRDANKVGIREREDLKLYGFAPGEREALEFAQNGACAICGRPPKTRRLNVDHCHKCAKKDLRASIRGLLCQACNRGLFKENPVLLHRAAIYFATHRHVTKDAPVHVRQSPLFQICSGCGQLATETWNDEPLCDNCFDEKAS